MTSLTTITASLPCLEPADGEGPEFPTGLRASELLDGSRYSGYSMDVPDGNQYYYYYYYYLLKKQWEHLLLGIEGLIMETPAEAVNMVGRSASPASTPAKRSTRVVRPSTKIREAARQPDDLAEKTTRATRLATRIASDDVAIIASSSGGANEGRAMLQKVLELLSEKWIWTTTTFTKLRMDNANATKSLQEVLQLLFDKLQREFADEVHLRTTLINACRGVPELEHALFKPSNKIEALFADLRSSIETHLARGTTPQYAQDDNQQYYLDRRYNNNRERGSGYRGSRDFRCQSHNRGRFNQRPQGNNNRPWTRKCFVCNKEGCWSIKHTAEERQKAKSQYVAHCHFTGTPVELAAYVTDYEGIEDDPLTMTATGMRIRMTMLTRNTFNHLITGEDAYRTDQNTVPASQFVIEDRYSKDKFQGIMIDTGAAKVSTAGHSQYIALQREDPSVALDSSKSGQATIKFGNGEAIHSVGSIALKTPVGRITFHILQTPTLSCFLWPIWTVLEYILTTSKTPSNVLIIAEDSITFLTEAEIPVPRLYHLLKQAGHSDVSIGTLETVSNPETLQIHLKDDQEFNYEIIVDVIHCFPGARFLPSMSAKDTWETLRTAWIDTYLGPPDTIRHDAGTNFASMEFRQEAKLMGIKCSQVPVETHWSIGKIERYHAPLRRAYDILNAELSNVTSAEAVLQMAVKAINDTAGPDGIVPTLLVFGAYPRLTAESPPSASTLKRSAAMQKAMKTLRQLSAERQVKDALRTRNGPSTADVLSLPLQSEVRVWREKDGWQGPFKIASIDGHNVTIDTVNGPQVFRSTHVQPYLRRRRNPARPDPGTPQERTPTGSKNKPKDLIMMTAPPGQSFLTQKEEDAYALSIKLRNEGIITAPGAPFEESDNIEITDLVGRDRMIHGNHHIFRSRMVREVKGKDTKPYEKSRLVVQGHGDFEKTTLLTQSPTIQRVSQRLILAIAPGLLQGNGMTLSLRDITQAYPQSQTELFRTILTYLPTELQGKYPHGTIIRVIKPLYGIAEAGVHWYRTYQQHHLKNLDMSTSTYDSCLLITNTGPNTQMIPLCLEQTAFPPVKKKLEEAQFRAKPKTSMTPGTTVDFNGAKLTLLDIGSLSLQQKGQATKIATIDPKAFDHSQRYVEQRARGSYIASISLNKRLQWQIYHQERGLMYKPIDLATAKLLIFTDGSFANNKDLSSQLGYVIVLANETDHKEKEFRINGNIILMRFCVSLRTLGRHRLPNAQPQAAVQPCETGSRVNRHRYVAAW
ncbi:reverse transcriptase (RNA-dependent DNA polymerase) [Hirsutella rhossiliensis]